MFSTHVFAVELFALHAKGLLQILKAGIVFEPLWFNRLSTEEEEFIIYTYMKFFLLFSSETVYVLILQARLRLNLWE